MAEEKWWNICRVVSRKRGLQPEPEEKGNLKRCLNYWDVTSLGMGSTLGIGVYVLVGAVALKTAGPSILLSFLIAAVTSLFAGLCYAELGARVPLAGSAFIYTYVTVGELLAFMVGWNNILEFIFGTASVARGLSTYIDAAVNHSMTDWFRESMPLPETLGLSPFFDLFSFLVVLAVGMLLSFGVRLSSTVNNALSAVNVSVIIFMIIAGATKANIGNWSIPEEQVPVGYGVGGFFPYGVWGVLKGAAICFYGFVGFDVVNASGEEVKEPRKTIPIAILSILIIVFVLYAGVSIVVTMMVPYYEMVAVTSVASAFNYVGWEWAQWIILVGAIVGISSSLFGALFPLPRLLYSMASDGLFIHGFDKTSTSRQSPIIATVVPTAVISLLAAFLDLEQLVLMMCIGTLFSYTMVAICVMLLRYRSNYESEVKPTFVNLLIGRGDRKPSKATSKVIYIALFLFTCVCLATAIVLVNVQEPLIPVIFLHVLAMPIVIVMTMQPSRNEKLAFKTPLVPVVPCLSIYANVHLMAIINYQTWIRVAIWLLLGIPIYFLCVCCFKQNATKGKQEDLENKPSAIKNGKSPVQIVVESPTPPRTLARSGEPPEKYDETNEIQKEAKDPAIIETNKVDEILVQQIQIENNEEKEAKIIDLLDQVLQAEEDTYGEAISLKEIKEDDNTLKNISIPHRKSLSELSDAGSDASLGNQGLSKYDVIAQVHREDLPKVNEEEERTENNEDNFEDEDITAFNDSDTNSRTDESGYSDTIPQALSESLDDVQESSIPPPPPPPPPPLPPPIDENSFKPTNLRRYYSTAPRYSEPELSNDEDDDEVTKPRVSIQSSGSLGDGNMRFGSARQIKFMSKLNDIFHKTITNEDEDEPRRRSQSTGNAADPEVLLSRERPPMFLELKKEITLSEAAQNLRPVNAEEKPQEPKPREPQEEEDDDNAMSREDFKQKLENIFAVGGSKLVKPRLRKSNPPTPDDSNQTDQNIADSIAKLPKMDKNDTLKRQKAKFGAVLNSIRLSYNPDDEV